MLACMSRGLTRRKYLGATASFPAAGLLGAQPVKAATAEDLLRDLGVRPIINGAGAYTFTTGTLLRPEAVAAIQALSTKYVRLDELHDAVGVRIAKLLGAEAAMVTSGAAAALTIGTAAILTGTDPDRIHRIPDLRGMKTEVIVQKRHRFPYDHMVRNCGVRLVEVETREELVRAIGPETAMLLFLNKADLAGQIKMKEFIEIGRARKIPTFNDCAADVPPVEHLLDPIRLGFDLVCVSGGKGIRGPQSAGILAGRADLIAAARLNTAPHSDTIGRSCKVSKEEMVGMLVALEAFLREDQAAVYREWEGRVRTMQRILAEVSGVRCTPFTPRIANQTPHLRVEWDSEKSGLDNRRAMQLLREGSPSIELVPSPRAGLEIATAMLQPGEAETVARRIVEILTRRA